MSHKTSLTDTRAVIGPTEYDLASREAGWDSPSRAQKLVEKFVVKDSIVLDLGTGTGQAVAGYVKKGAHVIGLDKDPEMLQAASHLLNGSGDFRQANINKVLPIEDLESKVDVAQAVGVLEFAEDFKSILSKVKTVLKSDGVFVFTIETTDDGDEVTSEYFEDDIMVYRRSADYAKRLLEESGFSLMFDEAYGGYERSDLTNHKVPYHIFLAQLHKC